MAGIIPGHRLFLDLYDAKIIVFNGDDGFVNDNDPPLVLQAR